MAFEKREQLFEHYCDLYRDLSEEEFGKRIEARPEIEAELEKLFGLSQHLEGLPVHNTLISQQALFAITTDALDTVAREKKNGRTGYMGGPATTTTSRSSEEEIRAEAEKVWEDFWTQIVPVREPHRLEAIKRELHDFYVLMDNASRVYDEYTGGLISKPYTMPFDVIGEGNRYQEQSALQAVIDDLQDNIDNEIGGLQEGLKRAVEIVKERMP